MSGVFLAGFLVGFLLALIAVALGIVYQAVVKAYRVVTSRNRTPGAAQTPEDPTQTKGMERS